MKMMKKLLSTAAAIAISVCNTGMFSITAAAEAVDFDKYLKNGPSWLPRDFNQAMYFHNNMGTTYVEGDTVCIVYHVPDSCKMSADISSFKRDDGAVASSEYEWHIYSFGLSLPDNDVNSPGYHYEALVILNNCAKGFDVDISLEDNITGKTSESARYTFINDDGELKETDIYSWLPDSVPEFEKFVQTNGNITFRDGLLVYCNTVNTSAGFELDIEEAGSGKLGLAVDDSVSRDSFYSSDGGTEYIVKVYTGETEGDVDITFTTGKPWIYECKDDVVLTASAHIDENLNVSEIAKTVPEWIPQDYGSTVDFLNEHGSTFIKDGIICLVRNLTSSRPDEYPISFEGSIVRRIACYELLNKKYFSPDEEEYGYNVMAYDIPDDSDMTVIFKVGRYEFEQRTIESYSFTKDSTGYITQNDKYSWLPDCEEEFKAYYEKHGTFSVQDNYLMCCIDSPDYLDTNDIVQQYGSGAFIEEHEEDCSKRYAEIYSSDAEKYHFIKLLKPIKAGVVKLVIKDKNNEEKAAYFRITNTLQIIPADENELKTTVKGDCNGDGMIGISDMVTLKRWLHGKDSLSEYGIADVNSDGCVDVFDLVEMRKLILYGIKEEPRPVMLLISENYAWTAHQNVTVIDQYGSAYCFRYSQGLEDKPEKNDLLMMRTDKWYEKVLDIMATSTRTAGYIPDSAMTEINKFSENAAKYSVTEMNGIGYMCDYGSNSVYIIGTDADGKPVNSEIATFGDMVGWIDEQEAKDFVKMLSSYNIFGNNIIQLLEYNKNMFF